MCDTREEVDVDEVKLNIVLAGEVIPIDGVVVDGNCEVDEKTLTGGSFPVAKQVDSVVWVGTINFNGDINTSLWHSMNCFWMHFGFGGNGVLELLL